MASNQELLERYTMTSNKDLLNRHSTLDETMREVSAGQKYIDMVKQKQFNKSEPKEGEKVKQPQEIKV